MRLHCVFATNAEMVPGIVEFPHNFQRLPDAVVTPGSDVKLLRHLPSKTCVAPLGLVYNRVTAQRSESAQPPRSPAPQRRTDVHASRSFARPAEDGPPFDPEQRPPRIAPSRGHDSTVGEAACLWLRCNPSTR